MMLLHELTRSDKIYETQKKLIINSVKLTQKQSKSEGNLTLSNWLP